MRFPNEYNTKEDRIRLWEKYMDDYISNELLVELMGKFEFHVDMGQDFPRRLESVSGFMKENWDFRSKAGGGERSSVADKDQIVLESHDLIIEVAKSLGLIKCCDSEIKEYDYIFPLGGYRAATHARIQWAGKLHQENKDKVIALTAHRMIDEIEIPFLSYVPEEKLKGCDEFTTACYAMEDIFGCSDEATFVEQRKESVGICRKYAEDLYVLCAPTPEGKKRANTLDTLEYWHTLFAAPKYTKILCITSPIYTSYQTAALAKFAIDNDILLDFEASGECGVMNKVTSNYLQEIKGTVDAFVAFENRFCKE